MRSRISYTQLNERRRLRPFPGSSQRSFVLERSSPQDSMTGSPLACDIASSSDAAFRYTIPQCLLAPHAFNEFITGNNLGNRSGSDRVYPNQLDGPSRIRQPLDGHL